MGQNTIQFIYCKHRFLFKLAFSGKNLYQKLKKIILSICYLVCFSVNLLWSNSMPSMFCPDKMNKEKVTLERERQREIYKKLCLSYHNSCTQCACFFGNSPFCLRSVSQ